MNRIDVAILAGGRGERLRGLWNHPKCLVPIQTLAGRENVLQHLLRRCKADGMPRCDIWCVLGHGHEAVRDWLTKSGWIAEVSWIVEEHPSGTANALRTLDDAGTPLLVLNGDTIPQYDLRMLLQFYEAVAMRAELNSSRREPTMVAAWCKGRYAGAAVLGQASVDEINKEPDLSDLNYFLGGARRYEVPGYFDVGTPEAFRKLQSEVIS